MNKRRSMGTLKTGLRAQRTNSSTSGPTSANRMSKLPKPASGASSSTSRGRSGSMDRPRASLAAFSDFKTPRSKSAMTRTPLSNIHQNSATRDSRSSLYPPTNSMMKRGRSPGKRSSVYGMGGQQSKDNRPLGDKNWQKEVVLSLHKFCLDQQSPNQYPNQALTVKDLFQMSTTTFRTLFDFLYQFLEPDYNLPNSKTQPIHEIMPELLKKLSYPGTVSKSHFQTLGGPSFGNVLGVFHFLLVQAKMVVDVEKNSNLHFFPNRDNEGFDMDPNKPSKQELENNYFTGAYSEYMIGGKDAFPELLQDFSYAYSDLLGVDESQIVDMENDLKQLKLENQRLKDESGDCGALEDQLQKVEFDVKLMQDYICQLEEYIKNKRQSLVELKEAIRQTEIQTATLQATIRDLETECMVKGIDVKDTSNHNEEIIFALQSRVEAKKADLQDVDKMKWNLEQSMSNIVAALDGHKRNFNKMLIGLDDLNQARVFRNTEVDNLPVLIQEKYIQLSGKYDRMRKNAEDLKQKMAMCTSETIKHEKMERELRKEEKELNQRKIQLEHEIKTEDEALTAKTKEVKDKLAAYSSKQNKLGSSLKAKEEQLANLLQEKKEAERNLNDFVKQSQVFLTDKVERLEKRKAEEEAKRAQAFKEYEEYEGQLCKEMDKLSKKMKSKLDKMKKL